jgi:hypothetical protein
LPASGAGAPGVGAFMVPQFYRARRRRVACTPRLPSDSTFETTIGVFSPVFR